ncbi:MAG: sulfate permease-like transporter, superfamily [Betaproteobacteria bacterium]|nr:sulfate permease-like transporter, superfamily [Betaproteobacteria bacterium]
MVIGVVSLSYSFSFAALVFSGPLSSGLGYGISAAMVGAVVIGLLMAWKSAFPFAIAGPENNVVAVLAAAAALLAAHLPAGLSPRESAVNAMYLLVSSGVVMGLTLYVLGAARLGRWIRYVPYPVTGGFMAGVGWLMVSGGLQITTDEPLSWAALADPAAGQFAWKALAALAWAGVLTAALKRFKHLLAMPVMLLVGILGVLGVLALTGISLEEARHSGWLYGLPGRSVWWQPWSAADFALIDAGALADRLGDLVTVALVSTLTILMNSTALEIESHSDIDLDRELRMHGAALLANAACGGMPGNVGLSRSLLNLRLGSTSRAGGLAMAAASLGLMFAGPSIISFIPRLLLGGLIISMGGATLWSWLVAARRTCSWPEYLTILLIALVVIVWGFVTGVLTGVIASCLIFAVNYGRVSVVKHHLNAAIFTSSRVRAGAQGSYLKNAGDAIRVFVLQGFIFFGTADRLYRILLEQLVDTARPVEFMILDFRFVHGIDSSALSSFRKIHAAAAARGVTLVITGANAALAADLASLARRGWSEARYANLDAGLEWCESELLRRHGPDEHTITPDVIAWLAREFGARESAHQLLHYVNRIEVAAGEYLCRQGEAADAMFFVDEGEVSVERSAGDGQIMRLRTLGRHTMIGEMGLYRSELRAASVVAQHYSVVYVLSRDALERMRAESPALAEALCVALIRVMSERLAFANTLNSTLQA